MINVKDIIPYDSGIKEYLLTKRRTLIMELGAVEDLLGMDRSVEPKSKKKRKKDIIKAEVK